MRSNIFCTAAAALLMGTVAIAALTPATDANRRPMAALILINTFFAAPALLVAAGRD